MGLDRSGEIDYYEELGVERNASTEEIRDSFRALVRLLHPDHQRDEALKSIAEKQLRKLNRIYSVLSDPERRRRYDLSREGELRPPSLVFSSISPFKARELITRFIWLCTAVLGVILVIWLATDSPSAPVYSAPERANAPEKTAARQAAPRAMTRNTSLPVAQAANSDDVSQLRAALRAARSELDDAQRELAYLRSQQQAALQSATAPASASLPLTTAATTLADPGPPRLESGPAPHQTAALAPPVNPAPLSRSPKSPGTDAHQFAGFWFFARSSLPNRNRNLYYPEFIEATLTEQNGVVRGRYRSRYQIVDRAISPDVNFEFSGTPNAGTMICPWTGAGGARGQLTLRMVGDNDMKVDWTASEIGSVQGLASGTATLTRRLE